MKLHAIGIGIGTALAVMAGSGVAVPQTLGTGTTDGLVSAARNDAGLEWAGTFMRLCVVPPPPASGGNARGTVVPAGPPGKDTWYAEPAKVADNFYFLGTKIHSAWALVGSDGIIILEALFDYAAPDEIAGGMKKLGLDITKVKYVVISHAHADHDGGAKFLQDTMPSAHLVYGGPDWDAVDR
jgi:metallo-beta-lactamase class B